MMFKFDFTVEDFAKYVDDHGIIDGQFYSTLYEILNCYSIREWYIKKFGFVPMSEELLLTVSEELKGKKILSIMAGSGQFELNLKARGVDIIISDDFSWDEQKFWNSSSLDSEIEKIDCLDAIDKYGKDVDIVLMSWPVYTSDISYKVLLKCREYGLKILYVGEDVGGCTACNEFFGACSEDENMVGCDSINSVYSRWAGIYDWFYIVK